jgi:hypothetical protein
VCAPDGVEVLLVDWIGDGKDLGNSGGMQESELRIQCDR